MLHDALPTYSVPIFVDQFDNARAVSRLRAGVGFEESLSKVSASQLAEAIAAAELQQPEVEHLGERLRSSGGSKEAAAQIDAFLREEVSGGHFARQAADSILIWLPASDRHHETIRRAGHIHSGTWTRKAPSIGVWQSC
eukprot:s2324_g4.t1